MLMKTWQTGPALMQASQVTLCPRQPVTSFKYLVQSGSLGPQSGLHFQISGVGCLWKVSFSVENIVLFVSFPASCLCHPLESALLFQYALAVYQDSLPC